jgi:heme/copper-type cytochrome/quinol oxidase subunit 4
LHRSISSLLAVILTVIPLLKIMEDISWLIPAPKLIPLLFLAGRDKKGQ